MPQPAWYACIRLNSYTSLICRPSPGLIRAAEWPAWGTCFCSNVWLLTCVLTVSGCGQRQAHCLTAIFSKWDRCRATALDPKVASHRWGRPLHAEGWSWQPLLLYVHVFKAKQITHAVPRDLKFELFESSDRLHLKGSDCCNGRARIVESSVQIRRHKAAGKMHRDA